MADSDSSLSSPPATDDEMPLEVAPPPAATTSTKKKKKKKTAGTIDNYFSRRTPSPPPRKRPASPPREPVPEDNPYIAFIVMFRSRFNEAFPRGSPSVGPQDIEIGVVDGAPSAEIEGLLCGLLGLVLNRKKPVEKGHYGRALEEAIQTQKSQWPKEWTANPLSGGRNFNNMDAIERITLLHTLCLWSLNQNEQVKAMVNDAYKARTTKDRLDTNIPLSVQPWGRDGDRRRYWLVEGQNDTYFRVYRESDPKLKKVQWISVAGTIDEVRALAKKLDEEDGHREAKSLGERMVNAIPRFEQSDDKRKRREYRLSRKAAFARPEPGLSLYEGRTRGKRLRYTYSDEEDLYSDDLPPRRSGRHSGADTPAVPDGPTVTASGRQVKSRATGAYGEMLHSGQVTDRLSPATGDYLRSDMSDEAHESRGRSTRAANRGEVNGRRGLTRTMDSDEEDDATSWDGGDEDDDEPDQMELDDDDDDLADESSEGEDEPQSLMVTLRYRKEAGEQPSAGSIITGSDVQPTASSQMTGEQSQYRNGAPLAGQGALRQPDTAIPHESSSQSTASVPDTKDRVIPTQSHLPPVQASQPATLPAATSTPAVLTNGQSTTSASTKLNPLVALPAPQEPPSASFKPEIDSKVGVYSAPTPPYSTTEELPKEQHPQQPQLPIVPAEPTQAPPQYPNILSAPPAHAPNNWQ